MILILPPSERKTQGGTVSTPTEPEALKTIQQAQELLVSLKLSDKEYINWESLLPAGERFSGVVWEQIDKNNIDLDFHKVWIPNPIFGISNYTDLMPEYKLNLNPKFNETAMQNAYSNFINSSFANFFKNKNEIILDLTTVEVRKFMFKDLKKRPSNVYSINYLSKDKRLLGHNGKKVKGLHANLILQALSEKGDLTIKEVLKFNPSKEVFITIE